MDFSPATITRIEKAAVDNGFDQDLLRERDWLGFASTQCPLRIWLRSAGDTAVHAAFSQQNVARALDQYGMPMASPLPKGAIGVALHVASAIHGNSTSFLLYAYQLIQCFFRSV